MIARVHASGPTRRPSCTSPTTGCTARHAPASTRIFARRRRQPGRAQHARCCCRSSSTHADRARYPRRRPDARSGRPVRAAGDHLRSSRSSCWPMRQGLDLRADAAAIPQQPYRAIGGIHLRAGCERVRLLENHIVGGAGNGITLGGDLIRGEPTPGTPPPVEHRVEPTARRLEVLVVPPAGIGASGIQFVFVRSAIPRRATAPPPTRRGRSGSSSPRTAIGSVVTAGLEIDRIERASSPVSRDGGADRERDGAGHHLAPRRAPRSLPSRSAPRVSLRHRDRGQRDHADGALRHRPASSEVRPGIAGAMIAALRADALARHPARRPGDRAAHTGQPHSPLPAVRTSRCAPKFIGAVSAASAWDSAGSSSAKPHRRQRRDAAKPVCGVFCRVRRGGRAARQSHRRQRAARAGRRSAPRPAGRHRPRPGLGAGVARPPGARRSRACRGAAGRTHPPQPGGSAGRPGAGAHRHGRRAVHRQCFQQRSVGASDAERMVATVWLLNVAASAARCPAVSPARLSRR